MAELIEEIEVISFQTEVTGADSEDVIMITKRAVETIESIKQSNNVPEDFLLRIGTRSGGCSGMTYTLGFDQQVSENDKIVEADNFKLLVDKRSLFYLMGVTLDYTDGPEGSGFVFNNPHNVKTCGCGH